MKVYLGLDPSMRSSGFVVIDENEDIVQMYIAAPPAELYKEEELIEIIDVMTTNFMEDLVNRFEIGGIAIERMAIGAKSAMKELIAACWWQMRVSMKSVLRSNLKKFPVFKVVAVNSWRAKVINADDRALAKAAGQKIEVKSFCFDKLPKEVKDSIEDYIDAYDLSEEQRYDLSDAYWLAKYCKNEK
jgi:hypothetical protein